jgi:hypothetical protein
MQKKIVVLSAAMMMAVPTLGLAAMAASNTVNSAAIVDASIATADIANAAVTGAKIASGTISATNLASGAVANAALAAGAVTDAKISGTIAVSKLPVGTTSTTVAAGNHTHSGAVKYAQIVVVAKSGGDTTSPISALANISDASAAKPYLVKVMPGVYDLGAASLVLKPYVYLEGSGDSSVITSRAENADSSTCAVGTVNMANNSSLTDIKVVNAGITTGAVNFAAGVAFNNVKATLDRVTVVTGSDTVENMRNVAVCSQGVDGFGILNNVNLESHVGGGGHANVAQQTRNSSMRITNSRLVGTSDSGAVHVVNCHTNGDGLPYDEETTTSKVTILNSYIESNILSSVSGDSHFYDLSACRETKVFNTVMVGNGGTYRVGVTSGNRNITIANSEMYFYPSEGTGFEWGNLDGIAQISNSLIPGTINDLTNVKLFNNYDENLNPIPNHQ